MTTPQDETDRFASGLKIRREVVGEARVSSSMKQADSFSYPLQELATAFAWGDVWGRDDIFDRRSRSIATLAMLIALNRMDEFKVHVLGALNNGLSAEEVRELIIHAAVYCGFPAALEATRAAQEVIAANSSLECKPS